MPFVLHHDEPEDLSGGAHWFVVRRGDVLVEDTPEGARIPFSPDGPPVDAFARHVIGSLDGVPGYAVDAGTDVSLPEPPGYRWANLRALYSEIDEPAWIAAGRASQIVAWDRTHRFCGQCGRETQLHPAEKCCRVCPECSLMQFPRLSPAAITLVTRGENDEEALLAHGRQFGGTFYSCLAGFVEPGESLEECVVREIREEVGIEVKDVTYFKSQPWPFPNSLMIGFRARYAGGDLRLQESEIVDAQWFRPESMPQMYPRGGMSIAGWLVEDWLRSLGAI